MVCTNWEIKRPSVECIGLNQEMREANEAVLASPELAKRVHEFRIMKMHENGNHMSRFDPKLVYVWEREAGLYDEVFGDAWMKILAKQQQEKEAKQQRYLQWQEERNQQAEQSKLKDQEFALKFAQETGHSPDEYTCSFIENTKHKTGYYADAENAKSPTQRDHFDAPKHPKRATYACDFETTVYDGQTTTEVWAAAMTQLFDETEHVDIFHSLPEMFEHIKAQNKSMLLYFHNLKFDGWFWLSYLIKDLKFQPALDGDPSTTNVVKWWKDYEMPNNTVKCAISAMGTWYSITVKVNNKIIEIRDSLKLLPFSVERIGKAFKTKHRKLKMEYTGYRYAGCPITEDERKYIANDVLVIKEALEFMYSQGHSKLTIGSCCMNEFTRTYYVDEYQELFPNLYEVSLNQDIFGAPNADAYVRKSYRGGWCYLVRGKQLKRFTNGTTADVNSLYPSMMSSESGNVYPVGKPKFWLPDPNCTPEETVSALDKLEKHGKYYFVRMKTRFYIRKGYLPFIQIKNNLRYACNECLETSDFYDKKTGQYYTRDTKILRDTRHELVMTMTDFKLFREHYHLVDFEILDYCVFDTKIGLFDEYMSTYKKLKQESEGAMRELAKLFLNNLYGKMASSTNSNFKIPVEKDDGTITFTQVDANDKKPGYIPCGSAITSYARNFTIRAAQKNYHGVDEPGFIYADTDSIHCDLMPDQIKGIRVHDTEFCCWKLEAQWDVAWFTRQKTYIEHVTHENLKPIEKPFYNVKCAGMPEKCKTSFIKSLERYTPTPDDDFTQAEIDVINKRYNLEDFKVGLRLPGKLMPKRIPGGVLLVDTTYEMR